MTYKHYLLKNNLEDNKENFKKWSLEHEAITKHLNPGMLEQYIEEAYKTRFIVSKQ